MSKIINRSSSRTNSSSSTSYSGTQIIDGQTIDILCSKKMSPHKCSCLKVSLYGVLGALCACLFVLSIRYNYQYELTRDHVRFRSGFPSQLNWITSPYGTLKCYLFNVTNAAAFLNGTQKKLKLQQVGPIVYRIEGRNKVLAQNETNLRYQKIRYHNMRFDAAASVAPDILNQTVILPNFILLSTAAKLHDTVFLVRKAFNAITAGESALTSNTVYHFLWDFTTPALSLLSKYVPSIVANCGMLHNALRDKDEEYNVKIGLKNGLREFFHVISLNNKTYFPEQHLRLKYLYGGPSTASMYCPIDVRNAFDNSLFTPRLQPEDEFTIVAAESCRTLRMRYHEPTEHLGFSAYRYVIADRHTKPHCLENAMGIQLYSGMFDVTKCLFNDVPAAFSAPHFYDTNYNWTEHFEGLSPNAEEHDTTIIMEPSTGIPIEEKYRFQYNIPMPDTTDYNADVKRFNGMVVPTFWYEYDLDDLPAIVLFLMRMQVHVVPILQPILMAIFGISACLCCLKIYLTVKGRKLRDAWQRLKNDKQKAVNAKTQQETDL